jgi:hypothetical protein
MKASVSKEDATKKSYTYPILMKHSIGTIALFVNKEDYVVLVPVDFETIDVYEGDSSHPSWKPFMGELTLKN